MMFFMLWKYKPYHQSNKLYFLFNFTVYSKAPLYLVEFFVIFSLKKMKKNYFFLYKKTCDWINYVIVVNAYLKQYTIINKKL